MMELINFANYPETTPEQKKFIEWRLLPKSLREPQTFEEMAKQLGVARKTLYNWSVTPPISTVMAVCAEKLLENSRVDVFDAYVKLRSLVQDGNLNAIKLMLEIHGFVKNSSNIMVSSIEVAAAKDRDVLRDAINKIVEER